MKSIFLKTIYATSLLLIFWACGGATNEMAEEGLALQTTDTTAALVTETSADSLNITDSTSVTLEKEPSPDSVAPALAAPPKMPKTNANLPADLAQITTFTHKGFLVAKDSTRLLKIEMYLEKAAEKKYRGFYQYEGKTARIFLEGTLNNKEILNLVERINGKETGMFRIKTSEDKQWAFIGEWTSPDGNNTYKVYLQAQ